MFRRRTQDPLFDETTSSNASLIISHYPSFSRGLKCLECKISILEHCTNRFQTARALPRLMLPSSRLSLLPPTPRSTPTPPDGTSTSPPTRASSPLSLVMPPRPTPSTALSLVTSPSTPPRLRPRRRRMSTSSALTMRRRTLRLPRSVRSVSLLTERRRPPSPRPLLSLSLPLTSSLGVSYRHIKFLSKTRLLTTFCR